MSQSKKKQLQGIGMKIKLFLKKSKNQKSILAAAVMRLCVASDNDLGANLERRVKKKLILHTDRLGKILTLFFSFLCVFLAVDCIGLFGIFHFLLFKKTNLST